MMTSCVILANGLESVMLGVPALKLNAMVSSPAAPMPQFPLAGVPLAVKIASGKVQNASLVV